MTDPIVTLSKLDSKALHNKLMELYPNTAMRESMKQSVHEYKKHVKAAKLKTHQSKTQWRVILRDLKYEHNNTIVGARYHSRNPKPERDHAFAEYLKVLDKLRRLIEDNYAMSEQTPSRLAKEKGVPNNGEHWTDWVPDHIKVKIEGLFNGIPYTPKTKRKLPFQRTARPVPPRLNPDGTPKPTKRAQLLRTAREELEFHKRASQAVDNEKIKTKMANLHNVIEWLEQATERDAMPRTWHGVLRTLKGGE